MNEPLKDFVKQCRKFGEFATSSGGMTSEYFDLSDLLLNSYGLGLVLEALDNTILEYSPDAIGCLELLPTVIIGGLLKQRTALRGFVVRKQRKEHGTRRLIEGVVKPGNRVLLIEDVTSTGQSILKVVKAVEEEGGQVICIITILDRDEGSRELLQNYDFVWLFSKEDLE